MTVWFSYVDCGSFVPQTWVPAFIYLSILGGYLLLLVLVVRGLGRAFLCLSVGLSAVSSFVPRHRVRASGPLQLRRVA